MLTSQLRLNVILALDFVMMKVMTDGSGTSERRIRVSCAAAPWAVMTS